MSILTKMPISIDKKPFSLNDLAKRDFLNWLDTQFPNLGKHSNKHFADPEIENRFKEVNEAAMIILDLLIDTSHSFSKKKYTKHLINLSFAFEQKDIILYTHYLNEFRNCIKENKYLN